jgi:hypothetical protein
MTKQAKKPAPAAKAADPHAAQNAKLAETLLAQHRAKGAKQAARVPAAPAPAAPAPTTAAPPAAAPQPGQPQPEAKATEPAAAKPAKTKAAPDMRTIKLLVDKNPRREGTGRHALFAIIMAHDGQTVAAALAGGATQAAIASAVRHEWIRLS